MINNIVKIILGSAVVAAVGAGVAVMVSNNEESVAVIKADESNKGIKIEIEDKSIVKKIKEAAKKKAIKILAFVALHMQQIEAISAIIGVTTGLIHIAGAIRDFKQGSELKGQLDRVEELLLKHDHLETDRNNVLGTYVQSCTNVLNDNLKTVDGDIIKIADKLGVQILEPGEVL